MTGVGHGLFRSNRKLNRFFERLPIDSHEMIKAWMESDHDPNELMDRLEKQFLLRPLAVKILFWTQVDAVYCQLPGSGARVCRMLGHVPYEGSKILWHVPPAPGFEFPLRGMVGKTAAKLGAYMPNKDVAPFEAMVNAALEPLREALHAFQPTVHAYNDRIREELRRQLNTF